MFARILFAAVVAGLAAGLVMSAIQQWRVTPLILEAELYEGAGHSHGATEEVAPHDHPEGTAPHDHGDATAAEEPEEWAPADGTERTVYTILANLLVSVGFALVLVAVSVVAGVPLTFGNAVLWGLAGFVTFQLAPAFGLPPELPGMPAGDLAARQIWWWGTVLATAAACFTLARWRTAAGIGIAIVLFALPHLIGAPAVPDEPFGVPAHLANSYAANAIGTAAIFWFVLAPALAFALERFSGLEQEQPA